MNVHNLSFSLPYLLFLVCPLRLFGCYLWGTDSGECTTDSQDRIWRATNMPFCTRVVAYPACVPKVQSLPPTRAYPEGRWFNSTVLRKDQWVQESALAHIALQIGYERNQTLRRQNKNQYGVTGRVRRRFYKRPDCQNAFKSLYCYLNFPRCDPSQDLTLPTCRSACENFFKSCGYERALWRCGKSEFFNGYRPEAPKFDSAGNATYLREYFPGQPFRENKFDRSGDEITICTPAILGAASDVTRHALGLSLLISLTVALLCYCL